MASRSRRLTKRAGKRGTRPKGDGVGEYFEDAWSLAKRTANGLNEIRKLINIEYKDLETVQSSAAFDTTGTIYPLSQVAQGTDYTERVGDSLKMQSIELKYRIFRGAAATTTICRVILFRDLDGYGTLPSTANVLQTVGAATSPLTPLDFLNRSRFAVIADDLLTVSSTELSAVGSWTIPHNGHILYLGSTAAATSNGKGSVYLLALSDETVNTPSIAFSSRIVFTDD